MAGKLPRVLVVEDEWIIAEQIATVLEDAGYEVIGPVGRVKEALVLLECGRIDAALIDINVHGDRSFEFAGALAAASIPFAFLSGYTAAEVPAWLRDRPLMQKPFEALAVRLCVADLIGGSPDRSGT